MVLNHIRVSFTDKHAQLGDQTYLVFRFWGLNDSSESMAITDGHHENAPSARIKRGCFKIKLQSVQVTIVKSSKIHLATLHKKLLDWSNSIVFIWQFIDTIDLPA